MGFGDGIGTIKHATLSMAWRGFPHLRSVRRWGVPHIFKGGTGNEPRIK